MPSKRPISVSFNLPFTEAIDALRARRVMLPDDYYMMPAVVRRDAFMISGLAGLDQVEAVKEKLASILEKGRSFKDFQGFAKTLNWDVTPAHLETIYRTAIQTAYNAGAWKHFEQSKLDSPYLMYTAVNDSRTRPAHRRGTAWSRVRPCCRQPLRWWPCIRRCRPRWAGRECLQRNSLHFCGGLLVCSPFPG